MKAAVVSETGAKLEIRDRPVPEPGPGQVLVRMLASALCHTDVHLLQGDWPLRPSPSSIPGHEGVGVVEALGPSPRCTGLGSAWRSAGSARRAGTASVPDEQSAVDAAALTCAGTTAFRAVKVSRPCLG
ncbi:alcohol dehydrogenase catalytic domain-containing protein [Amycolatopsis thermoflava]|uniref:alcohol dehydrogenase catalytic domain-containing protein n=1 Tax=Amycolatopsis thermoflava TaxID=84480 RepID=UPI003658582A